MRVAIAGRQVAVDLPHAVFATAIAGWCLWYFLDARASAPNLQNLILIEPATLLVLVLWLVILRETIHVDGAALPDERRGAGPERAERKKNHREKLTGQVTLRIFGSMALLGLYVLSMSRIGLDLATFLYILASLFLLGERRVLFLILVPLIFTAVVVFAFDRLLATPLPLLLGWAG